MEARNRRIYNKTSYLDGSTARKLSVEEESAYEWNQIPQRVSPKNVEQPELKNQRRTARHPQVGRGIDFFSMVFLIAAMGATLYVCFNYLTAQSDSVQLDKQIVALESEIGKLTDKNDAIEIELNQPIDLNEVYRIAVGELGMVHPNKNETIEYESNDVGYVRQFEAIPDLDQESFIDKLVP